MYIYKDLKISQLNIFYIYIYNYGSTQTYTQLKIYNHQTPKYSKGCLGMKRKLI